MTSQSNMETYESRFQSFSNKLKSSRSSKSQPLNWPHPSSFKANPKSLSEAGFFFNPSKDDPDNVECFLCGKELGGWEADDDPFEIHYRKRPKCAWALARCSLEFDLDENGEFVVKDPSRLPSDKVLEKARLETFGGKRKWWPHDSVKGHGAASKSMAKAGFVYTPQTSGDDTATCFYCDLSLSGWDVGDNPLEEHRRREERSDKSCPFFNSHIQSSPLATPVEPEPKPKRATSKKPSKTAKAQPATKSNEDPQDGPPPVKKTRKPRATKANTKKDEPIDEPNPDIVETELEPPPQPLKKSTSKKTKTTKRAPTPEPEPEPERIPLAPSPSPPPRIEKKVPAGKSNKLASSQPAKSAKKAPAKTKRGRATTTATKDTPIEDEADTDTLTASQLHSQPQNTKPTKPPSSRPSKPSTSEKPPSNSNVNGKVVSKGYKDIVVDLPPAAVDGTGVLAKSGRRERSRSVSGTERSRSRSAVKGETSESEGKRAKGKGKARAKLTASEVEETEGDDGVGVDENEFEETQDVVADDMVVDDFDPEPQPEPARAPTSKSKSQPRLKPSSTTSSTTHTHSVTGNSKLKNEKSTIRPPSSTPTLTSKSGTLPPSSKSSSSGGESLGRNGVGRDGAESSDGMVLDSEEDVRERNPQAQRQVQTQALKVKNKQSIKTKMKPLSRVDTTSADERSDGLSKAIAKAKAKAKAKLKGKGKEPMREQDSDEAEDEADGDSEAVTDGRASRQSDRARDEASPKSKLSKEEESSGVKLGKPQSKVKEKASGLGFSRTESAKIVEASTGNTVIRQSQDAMDVDDHQDVGHYETTPSAPRTLQTFQVPRTPPGLDEGGTIDTVVPINFDDDSDDDERSQPRFQAKDKGKSKASNHVRIQDTDPEEDIDVDDFPIPPSIIDALSSVPLPYISSLTDEERAMTVEQWIRHEMEMQYEQLKRDGETWIEEFKRRAGEVRKRIEAL